MYQTKVTIAGKEITIKAGRERIGNIRSIVEAPIHVQQCTQSAGCISRQMFGQAWDWSLFPAKKKERYDAELKAFAEALPDEITSRTNLRALPDPTWYLNYVPTDEELAEIREAAKTPEQRQAEARETAARDERIAAQKAQDEKNRALFKEKWARQEKVEVPEGKMAVYLDITFNDSDSMTDYFNPHRSIGKNLVLAIVPKGAEKEATARAALEQYPELAALEWEWKTEKYSGGNGNYLICKNTGESWKTKASDGREEVALQYEIAFDKYIGGSTVLAYKSYPGEQKQAAEAGNAAISHNQEKNGIEVRFPGKPDTGVLQWLKSHGFRWSKFQKIWYTKFSDDKFETVSSYLQGAGA